VRISRILLVGTTAAAAVALAAAPAAAVTDTAETDVTFVVLAGALTISAPPAVTIGSPTGVAQPPGTTIIGAMGDVTVSDLRGSADATWTASVYSTDFCIGDCATATPTQEVAASLVDYWSGLATTTGDGAFTEGQTNATEAAPLGNTAPGLTAYSHDGGTGINSAIWDPTLEINVPLSNEAGTYTGTVTHQVVDA
jgi:hypothetical protein